MVPIAVSRMGMTELIFVDPEMCQNLSNLVLNVLVGLVLADTTP